MAGCVPTLSNGGGHPRSRFSRNEIIGADELEALSALRVSSQVHTVEKVLSMVDIVKGLNRQSQMTISGLNSEDGRGRLWSEVTLSMLRLKASQESDFRGRHGADMGHEKRLGGKRKQRI